MTEETSLAHRGFVMRVIDTPTVQDFLDVVAAYRPRFTFEAFQKRSATVGLRTAIDKFGATLPPGSAVAVRAVDPTWNGASVQFEWTLSPVFPGQAAPYGWGIYAQDADKASR